MTHLARTSLLVMIFAGISLSGDNVELQGREPSWYPYTIARLVDRGWIRETPIQLRPYRPLHFYGNTQRRMYYRGNPWPRPRDYRNTLRSLIRRR